MTSVNVGKGRAPMGVCLCFVTADVHALHGCSPIPSITIGVVPCCCRASAHPRKGHQRKPRSITIVSMCRALVGIVSPWVVVSCGSLPLRGDRRMVISASFQARSITTARVLKAYRARATIGVQCAGIAIRVIWVEGGFDWLLVIAIAWEETA